MTVMAILAGPMPAPWSTGTGSELMRRTTAPTIGAMIVSTSLTLIVIPAIQGRVKSWLRSRAAAMPGPLGSIPG